MIKSSEWKKNHEKKKLGLKQNMSKFKTVDKESINKIFIKEMNAVKDKFCSLHRDERKGS